MKRSSLPIFFCIALTLCITGCSSEIKGKSKESKAAITNGSSGNTDVKNSDQELCFKRDLNKDGVEENIKVIFKSKEAISERAQSYVIIINTGDKKYTYEAESESNVIPGVNFSDFDTKDKYIEFYISSEGPSGDPSSSIYRFDNSGIKKLCDTVGHIKEYDREGKIYTEFSKTNDKYTVTLSCYDINKGKIEFVDKKNLVGKKLQYDNSVILFTDSAFKNRLSVSYLNDNDGKEEKDRIISNYERDSIVKVCEANEILTIVDIDITYGGIFKDGTGRNIRIKVKTSEGKEGWLEWLNGGD